MSSLSESSPQDVSKAVASKSNRGKLLWTLALFAVGIGLCVMLAVELGAAQVRAALWSLASWLPALFLLEAGRFWSELLSARWVLHPA